MPTASLLIWMDQVEPGWLSPEDEDAWRVALRAQKEFEKSQFFAEAEKLRGMWGMRRGSASTPSQSAQLTQTAPPSRGGSRASSNT